MVVYAILMIERADEMDNLLKQHFTFLTALQRQLFFLFLTHM